MAALNFPNSPSLNDTHTENGVTFKWNGAAWDRLGDIGAQGAAGAQGAVGAAGAQGSTGPVAGSSSQVVYKDGSNNPAGSANLTFDGTNLTVSGNLNVGGVLTYEDVTNVDSVGFVTATGLDINGSGDISGPLNVSGNATFHGNLDLHDNDILRIGTGDDLQIYHDGSKSLITDSGTGWLEINTNNLRVQNAAANETLLYATENGSVDLYYDNSKKFETTTTGVTVTNDLVCDGTGDKAIRWATGGTNKWSLYHNNGSGALVAYDNANNAERLRIDSSGNLNLVSSSGTLTDLNFTDNSLNVYARVEGGKSGSGVGDLRFHTYSGGLSEQARITSAGEVYIGSTAANGQGKLFVNDSSGATTTQAHVRNAVSTGTAKVFLNLDDSKYASVGLEDGSLIFRNSTSSTPTERLRVNASGTLIVASGGNLQMASNGRIFVGNGGNATNPMFANVSDTNTGIAFPSADTMMFTTGGSESLRIDSSGNATFKYKVTIGDSYGGGEIFKVGKSSGTSYLAHYNGGTAQGFIGHADQLVSGGASDDYALRARNDLVFSSNGTTERLRIASNGLVTVTGRAGAAANTAIDPLSSFVLNDGEARLQLCATNGGSNAAGIILSNESKHFIIHQRGPNVSNRFDIGYLDDSSPTDINNQATRLLSLDSAGNMGLGVTPIAPGSTALHLGETTASQPVRLHMTTATTGATASDGFTLSIDGGTSVVNMIQRENSDITFYTNNTDRLLITGSGGYVLKSYGRALRYYTTTLNDSMYRTVVAISMTGNSAYEIRFTGTGNGITHAKCMASHWTSSYDLVRESYIATNSYDGLSIHDQINRTSGTQGAWSYNRPSSGQTGYQSHLIINKSAGSYGGGMIGCIVLESDRPYELLSIT